jgi:hypothetical protein
MSNFKVDDWVTWKDPQEAIRNGFRGRYGMGPFQVGDVRGNTLDIIHYSGFPRNCHHLRHETGMSADFFTPSDPPKSHEEGATRGIDEEEEDI